MIIAIWGKSATGKTTIANKLSEKLAMPLRSCGEEIRRAAKMENVPSDDAPDALHRSVDEATRSWALEHAAQMAIMEGRFLDQVLKGDLNAILVQVFCNEETRLERWTGRRGKEFDKDDLAKIDSEDDLFRLNLYGNMTKGPTQINLDTSSGLADEWAAAILAAVFDGKNRNLALK